MKDLKFTQKIKDQWLEALKSGKYTQCSAQLENNGAFCCIGVLGVIHPKLNNSSNNDDKDPYIFLSRNLGVGMDDKIYRMNDKTFDKNKPDYSNVIPLIESLPVQK